MKCKKCGNAVRENWDFCPVCGTQVQKAQIVRMPIRFNFSEDMETDEDFDSMIQGAFKEAEKLLQGMGFPGRINFTINNQGPEHVQRIRNPAPAKKRVKHIEQPQRAVKSVEEPEMRIGNAPDGTYIELKVPGVTSVKDIIIKKLKESIEVRAYVGDKMYFKLIPITPDADIAERKFVNGVLSLKIQK
jgi:hypothetical protein